MSEAPSDTNKSGDTVARWHRFYLEKLPVIPSDHDLGYQIKDWNTCPVHHNGRVYQLFYIGSKQLLNKHGHHFIVERGLVVDLDDWA